MIGREAANLDGDVIVCAGEAYSVRALMAYARSQARHRVRREEQIDDLCQEALVELVRRAVTTRTPFAYLRVVIRRLGLKRQQARERRAVAEDTSGASATCDSDVEDLMLEKLGRKRALRRLLAKDLRLLTRVAAGEDEGQIASELGCTPGALRVRVHRLRHVLQAAL